MNRMSKTASTVNTLLGERRFVQMSNDCTRFLKKRSAKAERHAARQEANEQVMDFGLSWPQEPVEQPPVTTRMTYVAVDRAKDRRGFDVFVDSIEIFEQTFYVEPVDPSEDISEDDGNHFIFSIGKYIEPVDGNFASYEHVYLKVFVAANYEAAFDAAFRYCEANDLAFNDAYQYIAEQVGG